MRHLLPSFFALIVFAACNGETLNGGSSTGADAGPAASGSSGTSGGASSAVAKRLGEGCTDTAECAGGLECLPFAVHKENGPCEIVSTMCTKRCKDGSETDCSALGASVMCLSGCSDGEAVCGKTGGSGPSNQVTFTIADAPEALTTSKADPLFVLTVKSIASGVAFRFTDVAITVEPAGETGNIVPCEHDDKDGNGNVDVGETLSCKEPPVDVFGPSLVGQTVPVSFVERADGGGYIARGSGSWLVTN